MLDRFLYYCVAIPWSRLPLGMIYLLSDCFYFVIRFIIPYRKKVVMTNISHSFPDKTEKEHKEIAKKFYRYFADIFAESVKNLTISESKLKQRLKVRNPEIMADLYAKNKDVILLSSHYNNWEFLITGQHLLFDFQAFGIGTPLSNKFWDKKLNERRERFGMKVIHSNNYKEELQAYQDGPSATLVLGDQNPSKNENCYWTKFLGRETAFFFGAEYMANKFDMAVVSGTIHKVKRGYYELELSLITENPTEEKYGFITQTYIDSLENDIRKHPEYWLWSHKRWKKGIPANLEELKENHKVKFEEKFRKVSVDS